MPTMVVEQQAAGMQRSSSSNNSNLTGTTLGSTSNVLVNGQSNRHGRGASDGLLELDGQDQVSMRCQERASSLS